MSTVSRVSASARNPIAAVSCVRASAAAATRWIRGVPVPSVATSTAVARSTATVRSTGGAATTAGDASTSLGAGARSAAGAAGLGAGAAASSRNR